MEWKTTFCFLIYFLFFINSTTLHDPKCVCRPSYCLYTRETKNTHISCWPILSCMQLANAACCMHKNNSTKLIHFLLITSYQTSSATLLLMTWYVTQQEVTQHYIFNILIELYIYIFKCIYKVRVYNNRKKKHEPIDFNDNNDGV